VGRGLRAHLDAKHRAEYADDAAWAAAAAAAVAQAQACWPSFTGDAAAVAADSRGGVDLRPVAPGQTRTGAAATPYADSLHEGLRAARDGDTTCLRRLAADGWQWWLEVHTLTNALCAPQRRRVSLLRLPHGLGLRLVLRDGEVTSGRARAGGSPRCHGGAVGGGWRSRGVSSVPAGGVRGRAHRCECVPLHRHTLLFDLSHPPLSSPTSSRLFQDPTLQPLSRHLVA
jgi:hypothetical protein